MNKKRVLVAAALAAMFGLSSGSWAANAEPIPQQDPGSASLGIQTLRPNSIVPVSLTAGSAVMSPGLTVLYPGDVKNFWVNNFNTATSSLTWTVHSTATTEFRADVLESTTDAVPFVLTNDVSGDSTTATSQAIGWNKLDLGVLTIPAGTSHLTLSRLTSSSRETDVKSIDLLPQSQVTKYTKSVEGARADSQWLTKAQYGLFLQYGAWGFPQTGPAKSLDDQACGFDVPKFVQMVQSTGAAYVLWSYTWYQYKIDGPNPVVDTIMGNGDLTARCDLIGQIASALHQKGIKFLLYYHNGHGTTASWWDKQNWPANFGTTGVGDRTTFFDNWQNVIGWVGKHYGKLLDGWWFDDGIMYYPADFAALEKVARKGNPDRLISWNSWVAPRLTDYQDYTPGEGCDGASVLGSPVDGTGTFSSGPEAGLRSQCLYMLNDDWGVHSANTTITNTKSLGAVRSALHTAIANNTALSFNFMMYENGDVNPTTLAVLQEIKKEFRDGQPAPTPSAGPGEINNDDQSISYSVAWTISSNRNAGDYDNDVSYTSTAGDSFDVAFNGTGIDYVAPKGNGYASVSLTLDGKPVGTVSATASSYTPQQVLYSVRNLQPGVHHLIGTAATSGYLQVDAFNIVG